MQEKQLKKWVRERGFTALTIKKRGVDLVPEKLRAVLLQAVRARNQVRRPRRIRAITRRLLVFTRVGSGQQARRIGWHVRPIDFSDAAHVSVSDTKNSAV